MTVIYQTSRGYYAKTASGGWTPVNNATVEKGLDKGIYTVVKASKATEDAITGNINKQNAANPGVAAGGADPCAGFTGAALALAQGLGLCGGGTVDLGGEGGSTAYSQTAEGMAADQAFQEKMARLQAEIDAAAADKDYARQLELMKLQQEFQKQQDIAKLKQDRLKTYTDLLGNDPVRAVLYALGVGGETTGIPTEQFEGMEPIAGAEQKKAETEKALKESFMKYGAKESAAGTAIAPTIGSTGVEGLSSPEKMARLLMQGDEASKKLATSAFGVGNKVTGGLSPEELLRRVKEVTPMGSLRY